MGCVGWLKMLEPLWKWSPIVNVRRRPFGTNECRPAQAGAASETLDWSGSPTTRQTFLTARYRRIAARRGRKRAAVAIAQSLLIAVYHVLKEGVVFQALGYKVTVEAMPA